MTRIFDDPDSFVDAALTGLVKAHPDTLRRVDGGVVRARSLPAGRVAVVVGGGSGHYPAFAGLVGPGLAAGSVCGNIFSSPSAGQAYRVARAVEAGGGVLFSYGNYAGDVLHFGEAERRLREAGIDTRTVLVTDDIASAPATETASRRGIAGDLCVFRIAGAAAERGDAMDDVERLAQKANANTRSLGVAFAGCTLPGADHALFTVPEGMMSVGLGIHGEPGVRDVPMQTATELAATLLDPLLDERPDGAGTRVVPLVNGLGTVKYEELFVLFGHIAARLEDAGLQIVEPECGELVTSLDMAGVSLTLLWLDDELEELWRAPAFTPAYRKGSVGIADGAPEIERLDDGDEASAPDERREVPAASAQLAATVARLLAAVRDTVADHAEALGDLDAIAGDGDHGIGMTRGLDAAVAGAGDPQDGVRDVLVRAGDAWSEKAGGTSGALWGAGLTTLGSVLGDRDDYRPSTVADAVTAAVARIVELGGAQLGDKTMVDALIPYADEFGAAIADGRSVAEAAVSAATSARSAADETASLTPRKGRARPLAERSVGHPDPGAISFALIVQTIAESGTDGASHHPRQEKP